MSRERPRRSHGGRQRPHKRLRTPFRGRGAGYAPAKGEKAASWALWPSASADRLENGSDAEPVKARPASFLTACHMTTAIEERRSSCRYWAWPLCPQ